MILMEPDERLAQIRRARAEYDRARARLFGQIRAAITEGAGLPDGQRRKLGPSAIARASEFTREYITQLRDGKPRK